MTQALPETLSVIVEREIPYAPEKIWRALTQPHLIEEWLMRNDFAASVGHKFRLSGDWGGVECEVLTLEPNKTLSYTWDHANEDPTYALKSVVTFTLTPSEKGTQLRMEQVGFRPNQKQAFGGAKAGWKYNLENLETVVSRLD